MIKSAKDIFMWVSCVSRLGYCSTQGLRSVTGWTLSSPNRPWSMASGGMLSGNLPPRTGCPPTHQRPVSTQSGGLWAKGESINCLFQWVFVAFTDDDEIWFYYSFYIKLRQHWSTTILIWKTALHCARGDIQDQRRLVRQCNSTLGLHSARAWIQN